MRVLSQVCACVCVSGYGGGARALACACATVLSLSDKLIHDSAGVNWQAGQGVSTAHAAATVFCLFQKH